MKARLKARRAARYSTERRKGVSPICRLRRRSERIGWLADQFQREAGISTPAFSDGARVVWANQKPLARQTKITDFWFKPMKAITDNPGAQLSDGHIQGMMFRAIFFVLLVACFGCQTQRQKLHTVVLSDGVSQSEALIIGESYFAKHLAGGKITGIQDGGVHWIVAGRLDGYVAKPLSFEIDKHSGKITSQIGFAPSYICPFDIYR
jgi:hypothetical protein